MLQPGLRPERKPQGSRVLVATGVGKLKKGMIQHLAVVEAFL